MTGQSWSVDMAQWFHLVDQMIDAPVLARNGLEETLQHAFESTQANVHVVTGSLRGSGRTSSDVTGDTWVGEITYGGPSPGYPRDPVVYAGYEQNRGGAHDFMAGVEDFTAEFVSAMEDWL
jgi:hypothetical protein